jgi:cystathionine gamma-synthase
MFGVGASNPARGISRSPHERAKRLPLQRFWLSAGNGMSDDGHLKPATLAANPPGGAVADGAVVPPWQPATTYTAGGESNYSYLRADGPQFADAERRLAALENGADALLFGSGMAAADAVFRGLAPGSRVIIPEIMYWALRDWLKGGGSGLALDVASVPNGDAAALRQALASAPTALVWIETPANPLWSVTDIAETAELSHAAGARLAVDSTVATPILTRPLELGADIVMHSATKYLNGHSDVLAGALVTARDDEAWARIRTCRTYGGANAGTFEAWLLVRGMRTLALRVERASANAMELAQRLSNHAGIVEVLYPGLPHHPGHAIAKKQMRGGFGGMLSIRVKGGFDAAARVAAATRLFHQATSLGGVESLIEHRAPVEGPTSPVPDDLLRLSVGIEDIVDLKADLANALA